MKHTRTALRRALVNATCGCEIQHDGWPCNSCFHALKLGVSNARLHELWVSVLGYRGDYPLSEIEQSPALIAKNIEFLSGKLTAKKRLAKTA